MKRKHTLQIVGGLGFAGFIIWLALRSLMCGSDGGEMSPPIVDTQFLHDVIVGPHEVVCLGDDAMAPVVVVR